MQTQSICSVPGCERRLIARGWCEMHYHRWARHGSTDNPRPIIQACFWAKVDRGGPVPAHRPELGACWLWTGAQKNGYGRFTIRRRPVYAHRFAYELLVGPIPQGLELDHLCRVTTCINPSHLEPVTHRKNVLRGISPAARHATMTHCSQGHPFDTGNTGWHHGARRCLACHRESERRRRHITTHSTNP